MCHIVIIITFILCHYKLMELPHDATYYKPAKNGGQTLVTSDGHEFAKVKDDGKRIHYFCQMKVKSLCKVTAAVLKSANQVIQVMGEHTHDMDLVGKVAETMEPAAIQAADLDPDRPTKDSHGAASQPSHWMFLTSW